MESVAALLGMAIIVVLVFAVLAIFSIRSSNKKDPQAASEKPINQPNKGWQGWIVSIGISLFIAIWTIGGALIFLAFVWLMRLDPKPYSKEIPVPTDTEKTTARRLYIWLILSPFITVPIFILATVFLSQGSSTNERVIVALIPVIFYLPLLFGFTTKSPFVFRHTQQAIFLVALRAAAASFAISIGNPGDGLWVFFIGNGVLWLGGSFLGLNQIKRSDCWLMKRKGERTVSAEGAKVDSPQMDQELEEMLKSLDAKDALAAKTKAINAFRTGTLETKRRAVEVLSKLGEVEEF
jgi:hypothetical protein